ncbi:hypothetical protein [Coxiella endosymbiont of Ornithodoros amblus]|nr:hypothetical protein [Coxiella endosymbiont of Ornithodoros amblus]
MDVALNEKLQWLLEEVMIRDNEEMAITILENAGRFSQKRVSAFG